jgi:hypothetical protein
VTSDERQAARARIEVATPPPWDATSCWRDQDDAGQWGYGWSSPLTTKEQAERDGRFAARARADLPAAIDALDAADAELAAKEAERDKLQRFKSWCHDYLDGKGVPHHPPGTHGAEGCRIGDRLDWVWARIGQLELENRLLRAELDRVTPFVLAGGGIVQKLHPRT